MDLQIKGHGRPAHGPQHPQHQVRQRHRPRRQGLGVHDDHGQRPHLQRHRVGAQEVDHEHVGPGGHRTGSGPRRAGRGRPKAFDDAKP